MTPQELRAWREERGWSQRELARRLGVDPGAVSRWEAGLRPPSPLLRLALAGLAAEAERGKAGGG